MLCNPRRSSPPTDVRYHRNYTKTFLVVLSVMFAAVGENHLEASVVAANHLKIWERALALRVSLQKPIDSAGRLPVGELAEELDNEDVSCVNVALCGQLRKQACELTTILDTSAGGKRKLEDFSQCYDIETLWEDTLRTQSKLQKQNWEPVLNKWHARINFGSENTKAKLKVFTQTMWDQVSYDRVFRSTRALVANIFMPTRLKTRCATSSAAWPSRACPGRRAGALAAQRKRGPLTALTLMLLALALALWSMTWKSLTTECSTRCC